jgi:hypothetical protein
MIRRVVFGQGFGKMSNKVSEMSETGLKQAVTRAAEAFGGAAPEAVAEVLRVAGSPEAAEILEDHSKGPVPKLGALAASLTRTGRIESQATGTNRVSAKRLITSLERLELIEVDVAKVRKEVFGNSAPPFQAYYPNAIRWLRDNARPVDPDWPEISSWPDFEGAMIESESGSWIPKWARKAYEFKWVRREIAYDDPESRLIRKLPVESGTALGFLSWFLRQAEEVTGFRQPALLIHVLTGHRPLLPRWEIRSRGHFQETVTPFETDIVDPEPPWRSKRNPHAITEGWDIAVNAPDITLEELQEVFKGIERMRGPRTRFLSPTDRILLEVVEELGGSPAKGARGNGQYWERVRIRCEQRGVQSFRTAHAPRKRYQRLVDRGLT